MTVSSWRCGLLLFGSMSAPSFSSSQRRSSRIACSQWWQCLCWYIPDEAADVEKEVYGSPALYGGKLALTTSSGDVFVASLIMGIVELAKRQGQQPCWWLDPLACLLKALMVCLEGIIGGLTRFAHISHLFHGGDLLHMGEITTELLTHRGLHRFPF